MSAGSADITSPYDSPTFGKDGSFEVDKPVGSMSISPCGRDVVLASRHGLHIIDLDSPWAPPRHLAHHTPWEVADVQWSPFPKWDHWVVSTSNQKALVWNLMMASRNSPIEFTLHGHSRALTDIQFSAHDPYSLATCAVDSFVHCWDLRSPQRPAYSFCDWFAGATQTKWNRMNPHIIASSHDRTLHIWDNRKGAYPLRSLDAHDTKIYGIDWNRLDAHKIITCSLDKSVKFWDYSAEADRPERLLRTPFPVWRARHTPFGQGIMAMPQRGDFNLHLYDCREESIWDRDLDRAPQLVERFAGHSDNVKEFLWRPRGSWEEGSDKREFQLVTWGADRFLRLHRVSDEMLQEVGFERGQPGNFTTRKNAQYRTFRVVNSNSSEHTTDANDHYDTGMRSMMSPGNVPLASSPTLGLVGWADAGFLNTQPGIRAKAPPRKDLDPISWMKGVKIGKHEDKTKQNPNMASLPTLSIDAWEQYENLGEEVKHVGQTFSKVEFGDVNINKRFLGMSLYGPWGKERAQVFISCRMTFPQHYPSESAELLLEESTSMSADNIEEIRTTASQILHEFAKRQKPSIEAVVRFLHGERTLDDLIGWLRQGLSTPNMLPTNIDEESSSDEEDELGKLPGPHLEELGLAGSDILTNSNANANVPLPRTCGALWSRDGRLTCFFRPKVEKVSSITGVFGLDGQVGSVKSGTRYFDGFGRINQSRAAARSRASSHRTPDDSESSVSSDSDDDSSFSTSGSSIGDIGSDNAITASQSLLQTSLTNQGTILKSFDDLRGSQTSRKPAVNYLQESRSVISIHNLQDIIPARREFAAYHYQGLDLGQLNAELALEHGSAELADAWDMASNLCQWHESSVLGTKPPPVGARKALDRSGGLIPAFAGSTWNTLAASLSDSSTSVRLAIALGLFHYFGAKSDIQMAATLACAFQPFITPRRSEELHHSIRHPSQHGTRASVSTKQEARLTEQAPTGSKFLEPDIQSASDPARPTRPETDDLLLQPPSLASSLGADESTQRHPFSTGNTPPSRRIPKTQQLRKQNSFSQLKPSPTTRFWQLDNATGGFFTGAGNFANAISQNFSFSASSSPPSRKWPSPTTSFTTAKSHQTRESKGQLGASMVAERRKWSIPDDFPDENQAKKETEGARPRKKILKVKYNNKNNHSTSIHKTASTFMSLEEQLSLSALFDHHRLAYADQLIAWCLPIARAEVLKHNSTPSNSHNTASQPPEKTPLHLGKRSSDSSSTTNKKSNGPPPGLLARRLCPFCSSTNWLDRRTAAFKCTSCSQRVPPLACTLCNKIMRGRTYPCFSCGHVLHARCRSRLATETGYDGRCIEGCDCACPSAVVVKVRDPLAVENAALVSPSAVHGAPRPGSAETQDTHVTEIKLDVPRGGDGEVVVEETDRGQAWEEMARESLARNLELRKARPGEAGGALRRARSSDGRPGAARERGAFRSNLHIRRGGTGLDTMDGF